jgi:hypothetical protein
VDTRRDAAHMRQNGDSTGLCISFIYLLIRFKFCTYLSMHCIELLNASHVLFFEGTHRNFRLSERLAAYLMIFSQGLSLCAQLFVECLDG